MGQADRITSPHELPWTTGPIRPRACTCSSVVCQLLHQRVMADLSRRMFVGGVAATLAPFATGQALGVDTGSQVAFDLRDGQMTVSRVDAGHEDPAITAFLNMLARDIEAGRSIRGLPDELARTMLEHAGHKLSLDGSFNEDVEL